MTHPPSPTVNSADRWNGRWEQQRDKPRAASDWVLHCRPHFPNPGLALDLACGRGDNAHYLAQQGWQVVAVDHSAEAAQQTAAVLTEYKAAQVVQLDLECTEPALIGSYDLILMMNFLHRPLFPWICSVLKPGGLFVGQAFSRCNADIASTVRPAYALHTDEFPRFFPGWQVLDHQQGQRRARNGATFAAIAVRRPLS